MTLELFVNLNISTHLTASALDRFVQRRAAAQQSRNQRKMWLEQVSTDSGDVRYASACRHDADSSSEERVKPTS
jgi:hypothetical protein